MLRIFMAMSLLLSACATDTTLKGTPQQDYAEAKHLIEKGRYEKADLFLDKFAAKHPYSQYSVQAELLRAFVNYKMGQYIMSETLAEEFVRRHPRHPDVAYAKYLLAMSHYKQISPPERDQGETHAAIDAFKLLAREHPGSSYARDGGRRLQKLTNQLAEHELNVGKFYFDRGRFVAAANRFQQVVKAYQTTPAIEEALYYLAASYAALGIKDESANTAKLLRHNYPKGQWSKKAERFL